MGEGFVNIIFKFILNKLSPEISTKNSKSKPRRALLTKDKGKP